MRTTTRESLVGQCSHSYYSRYPTPNTPHHHIHHLTHHHHAHERTRTTPADFDPDSLAARATTFTGSRLEEFAAADTGDEFPLEATPIHQEFVALVEGELEISEGKLLVKVKSVHGGLVVALRAVPLSIVLVELLCG